MAKKGVFKKILLGIGGFFVFLILMAMIVPGESQEERASRLEQERIEQEQAEAEAEARRQEIADREAERNAEARRAFEAEEYTLAAELYGEIIESFPSNGVPYYRYAYSMMNSQGYQEELFIEAYEKLSRYNSENSLIDDVAQILYRNTPAVDYREAVTESNAQDTLLAYDLAVLQDLEPLGQPNTYLLIDGNLNWYSVKFSEDPKLLSGDQVRGLVRYKGIREYTTNTNVPVEVPFFSSLVLLSVTQGS